MKIESPMKSLRNLTANPLKTRAIEVSRIKYDKLDASILADLVRWLSYIISVLK